MRHLSVAVALIIAILHARVSCLSVVVVEATGGGRRADGRPGLARVTTLGPVFMGRCPGGTFTGSSTRQTARRPKLRLFGYLVCLTIPLFALIVTVCFWVFFIWGAVPAIVRILIAVAAVVGDAVITVAIVITARCLFVTFFASFLLLLVTVAMAKVSATLPAPHFLFRATTSRFPRCLHFFHTLPDYD